MLTVVIALVIAWLAIAAIPSVDAVLEWLIAAIADRFTKTPTFRPFFVYKPAPLLNNDSSLSATAGQPKASSLQFNHGD